MQQTTMHYKDLAACDSTLRILAVEEDFATRRLLQEVLEADGHSVEMAASVHELLDRTNWGQYSVVLLDVGALESMAEDLVLELTKLAPGAATIVVCGDAVLDSTIGALRRGAADYLLKPINPAALRASLARIARLRTAERRAHQAERLAAIGQTMAVLAHESRNYFQECLADVEMLERRIRDRPEAHGLVEHLQSGLDRIHRLFEDLRDFAAPVKLIHQHCSLPEILQTAWASLKVQRSGRNVELYETAADWDLSCEADPFRIEQVFRNVLDNALAACPDPVRIEVSWCETFLDHRPAVEVVFRDNGPGIAEGREQQIFEPFFSTKTKGTGLGLAIARRIVEAHEGRLHAGCSPLGGAEFRLVLPCVANLQDERVGG